jgi:lipid A 4'-phosphatase
MSRMGLLIALGVATVVGAIFAAFPELDLAISAPFYDPATGNWAGGALERFHLRSIVTAVITIIAAPAVIAPLLRLLMPNRFTLIPGRAALLMISTLLLAPGLVANVILKDNWGRPRPFFITQFGGMERFLPWRRQPGAPLPMQQRSDLAQRSACCASQPARTSSPTWCLPACSPSSSSG